ncbi:universal stress protein [Hydrocarboniphaga sp.]|uniref:universal stress protein n=1 Tax=Hydrocarboniphaga sp. TaxID=2033016 RepID=UPI0026182ADB|nr:universal stress protein [Hydrocarboniphaga sp.]
MNHFRRIMLLASPSMRRTAAFERASWLAQTTGASLHISLIDYDPGIAKALQAHPASGEKLREAYLAQRRDWLAQEILGLKSRRISATTQVCWANPLKTELLAQIAAYAPDLIVKDVHHEPLLRRILLRPLDWQLLRECPSPLLLVGSLNHAVPKVVIAAVDVSGGDNAVSRFNRLILGHAQALATDCGAELHVTYAFILPVSIAGDFSGEIYDSLIRADRVAFDALAKEYAIPSERAHFLVGPPATEIVELAARKGADAIVLGASQHPWIDRLLMGTTAEAVLERSPCDVLAIKPEA